MHLITHHGLLILSSLHERSSTEIVSAPSACVSDTKLLDEHSGPRWIGTSVAGRLR